MKHTTSKERKSHREKERQAAAFLPLGFSFSLLLSLSLSLLLFRGVSAGESQPPRFVLSTAEGTTRTGRLVRLEEQWSVDLGGPKPSHTAGRDLVSLRRVGMPLPPLPGGQQVIFANGDRLLGEMLKLDGERLCFHASFGGKRQELTLPLSSLSVLWLAPPHGPEKPDLLQRKLAAGRRHRDVVLLQNGDLVEGILTAFDGKELQMEVGKKEVAVAFDKIGAVALNTALAHSRRPSTTYGHLVLADGSRLALASARGDARMLVGKTLFGATIQVPVEAVRSLDLYQGRAVYLSDLEPRRYEFRSYLGVRWPYARDGSVAPGSPNGRDLVLGGSTFDKGLGMHSESRLTYDLEGKYRRFEALVGLDDQTCGKGNARLEICVDGKARDLGCNPELSGRSPPQHVAINIAGAYKLTLVVKFGPRGDVEGRVDWAEARLLK